MKGSFTRSLAISLAAHALLFLFLALLIPHSPVVFEAPSVTFVEARTAGSGSPAGLGRPPSGRKGTPNTVAAAVPAMPRPTPVPQAPVPQAQTAQQAPATLPAAGPTASPSTSSSESPNQVASGGPSGSGPAGANGAGGGAGGTSGSGSGTANTLPAETDADPQTPIADINPVPMWDIAASYPSSARRLGEQGLVKVETDISAKGVVIACRVVVSSGFPLLDNAALNAVQQARFLPAMKNGRAVASKVLVPIRFQLTQP